MKIAIPSHNRPELLQKTLDRLNDYGFSGLTFDKPKYGKLQGGLQSHYTQKERKDLEKKGNIILSKMFPKLCSLKETGIGLRYKRI